MRLALIALACTLVAAPVLAQEKAQPKPEQKPAAADTPAQPPRLEPVSIKLPSGQMICQPRSTPIQCVACSEDNPCFLFQQARQPVK